MTLLITIEMGLPSSYLVLLFLYNNCNAHYCFYQCLKLIYTTTTPEKSNKLAPKLKKILNVQIHSQLFETQGEFL